MAATMVTSTDAGSGSAARDPVDFPLASQDALCRAQRAAGLIPRHGFGVLRRIAILVALTWVPIAVWAVVEHRAFEGVVAEPLFRHFGVHVRFLFALPLLILAEPVAQAIARRIVGYFQSSGLVPEAERGRFARIVEDCRRLLRSRLALGIIVAFVLTSSAVESHEAERFHEIAWGLNPGAPTPHLGFGAWWFVWVARPIYSIVLINWLWRLVVSAVLLGRISRLDLRLVASHPDGSGGLGFLESFPVAFAPVIVASSAVLSARWGHDVLYHGLALESLRVPAALFVALVLILFLGPLAVFVPRLAALRRQSLLAYGALVGRHGDLVQRRWIRGETVDDKGLLSAPELGPVADTLALYEAVARLRTVLIGRRAVLTVAAAAILPMLPVGAIRIPIREQLLGLIKILM